jgi:hypothetical protein
VPVLCLKTQQILREDGTIDQHSFSAYPLDRYGTATQRATYCTLEALRVFDLLQAFDPVLTGTIPLAIDIPGSDLDIVC